MITELEDYDPAARERILNRIAASLLPNPGVEAARPLLLDEDAARVLSSLRARLSHNKPGKSGEAHVIGAVADALSSRYLTDEKLGEIRTRLGDRGELDPGQAKIEYGLDLQNLAPFTALKRSDINVALYEPDCFERISGEDFECRKGSFPVVSLRVKRHRVQSIHAYSVLLICVHEADKITIWQALRVYDRDVGITSDSRPLDIFRAFVETYGVPVTIEGVRTGRKLVLEETFPRLDPGGFTMDCDYIPGASTGKIAFARVTGVETVEVAFAYCIRLDLYVPDLAKHGLPVKLTEEKLRKLKNANFFQPFERNRVAAASDVSRKTTPRADQS